MSDELFWIAVIHLRFGFSVCVNKADKLGSPPFLLNHTRERKALAAGLLEITGG